MTSFLAVDTLSSQQASKQVYSPKQYYDNINTIC